MYDGHIYCREYKDLKDYIADIVNGDIEDYDVEALSNHIYVINNCPIIMSHSSVPSN